MQYEQDRQEQEGSAQEGSAFYSYSPPFTTALVSFKIELDQQFCHLVHSVPLFWDNVHKTKQWQFLLNQGQLTPVIPI